MRGFFAHFRLALALSLRNRLALLYGYLLPAVFLGSFLVLYRAEAPLLVRHTGELLTVAILATACFGLPTSLVSERERGVWRRFRLTPASPATLVAAAVGARYVIVLSALAMQLALAMAIGGWRPAHPVSLAAAASIAALALLGLGLLIAALADTVPAAQAFGQSIFLPMLIIGGVAVRLDRLPEWVLPVASFLPGRYAVETIQASADGAGLSGLGFHVAALVVIGAASAVAGVKLFRWDNGSRFVAMPGKSWAALALASWAVVGVLAIQRGALATPPAEGPSLLDGVTPARAAETEPPRTSSGPAAAAEPEPVAGTSAPLAPVGQRPTASSANDGAPAGRSDAAVQPGTTNTDARPWRALTSVEFAALPIADMPPDDGNISPIAGPDEAPAGSTVEDLRRVVDALPRWAPGQAADPVDRVRNYLLILAVADFAQSPLERFLPAAVLAHLLKTFPPQELAQLLCWVAQHADEGSLSALEDPLLVRLGAATLDRDELRTRTYYYGVKLTRRVLGW